MRDLAERHFWVRISEKGEHRGAGFRVTRMYVLTAMHCLRDVSSEDAPLDIELPDGQVISGRLCHLVGEADLALIAVEDSRSRDLPLAAAPGWPRPTPTGAG